jgi:hypothetical protein
MVAAYLAGPFRATPLGRHLGPRLGGATVLCVGGWALGTAAPAEPVEVEAVLEDEEWGRLAAEARPAELDLLDPARPSAVRVRARGGAWLRARLATTSGLWLRQRASVVQDPGERLRPWIVEAAGLFRGRLPVEIEGAYRALREGLATADTAGDPVGRAVLLGRAAEAALALPLLARGQPYPPPRWLAWQLAAVCPHGEEIAALAARALAGRALDGAVRAGLIRLQDEILDQAGYGESVVRAYGRIG